MNSRSVVARLKHEDGLRYHGGALLYAVLKALSEIGFLMNLWEMFY